MYPLIRVAKTYMLFRSAPRLPLLGTHVSHHICWPQDIDIFLEMNNGRVLTLFDIGRYGLSLRSGLSEVLKTQRWGVAVAGSTIRYRKRILPFARFEMRTRVVGWDARFIYIEQSIWLGEDCAAHALLRTCVTKGGRMVPTDLVIKALGQSVASPQLPAWVSNWVAADATRPWPPSSC